MNMVLTPTVYSSLCVVSNTVAAGLYIAKAAVRAHLALSVLGEAAHILLQSETPRTVHSIQARREEIMSIDCVVDCSQFRMW